MDACFMLSSYNTVNVCDFILYHDCRNSQSFMGFDDNYELFILNTFYCNPLPNLLLQVPVHDMLYSCPFFLTLVPFSDGSLIIVSAISSTCTICSIKQSSL